MLLSDNIINIKNIGEERAKKLSRLGINTIKDLIEYFPREYEDRSNIKKINEIELNQVNTVKGTVSGRVETTKIKNITITKVKVDDDTGFLEMVWFNQPYLKNSIKPKTEYIFTGKVVEKYGRRQIEAPDFEVTNQKELLSSGRIIPIYSSTYKFSQKTFRSVIHSILNEEKIQKQIVEFLPEEIIKNYKLCSRRFAIENIHFPKDDKSFFLARQRLVFEELFILQVKLLQLKGLIEKRPCLVNFTDLNTEKIREILNFKLTNAQEQTISDIIFDLKQNKNINRLIQGDVGSGKTAIAIICLYIAVNNGYQGALMVPTDVLANQHFESLKNIFNKLDIRVELLSGSQTKKEKNRIYEELKEGKIQIVVGTHAIIQEKVEFYKLGLVITDEQHRFGVRQRNLLSSKSKYPHTIVMTATPIPRTLALILYGDLDISIINELPPGRQEIETVAVNSSYYHRIYNFIKKNCDEKKQVYIICPMIEEGEKQELKAVTSYTEKLRNEVFLGYSVECIHGKMKNSLKQEIMTKFYNGEIDILVSTTVIEVGINVPNATIILIENAERFGLSQLHQLRGRVGRGSEKSYCILISDSKNNVSKKRLKSMVDYSDGFKLSEKDLELRGPGDFFGTRQHGLPEMKIANLYKDMDILKIAQKVANDLYLQDPILEKAENMTLKNKIDEVFYENNDSSYL